VTSQNRFKPVWRRFRTRRFGCCVYERVRHYCCVQIPDLPTVFGRNQEFCCSSRQPTL